MKVSQAVEQLYAKLPFLTDRFTSKVNIDEIVFDGTTATVTTDTAHGLEINDTCTVLGLYSPLSIVSMIRVNTVITVTTVSNHDLTFTNNQQVVIQGANEPEFNGNFNLLSVPSGTTFTVSTVDSGANSSTGSPILEQYSGFSYNQIVGYRTVSEATTTNQFKFEMTTPLTATITSLGSVAVGYRITGAVSFESAVEMYTSVDDEEFWAFVVSNANVASKDRKNNSDAIYTYNRNTGYRQEINQTFSVFVFATASREIDAYPIKDEMQDIASALVQSLCGAQFDNGFSVESYYANVFDSHLTQFYNKGIYSHAFIFQTTTQITDTDIFNPDTDVAFRSIDLEMNLIVDNLQINPDTQTLDATIEF